MSVHTRTHHTKVLESSHPSHTEKRKTWREVLGINELNETGRVLRGFRIKEEMTQKDLADKLGVKPHHISEIEHAKRSIGKNLAHRLGKIFKVDYRIFL